MSKQLNKQSSMEQFKETIHLIHPGNYDLHLREAELIIGSSSDFVDMAYTAYKYGFLKGTRSEKAKQKKAIIKRGVSIK